MLEALPDDMRIGGFPEVPWFGDVATYVPRAVHDESLWAVVTFVRWEYSFVLARVPRGWCTPSGHIEPEESPEAAAVRECYEEAGITCCDLVRFGTFIVRRSDAKIRCAAVFGGRASRIGSIPANSESKGMGMYRLSQIPPIYWHWDELMKAMFDDAYIRLFDE